MKQMRYFVIAVFLGAGMCVAGLSGCKQDLDVDRVFYQCGSGSTCGPGYACGVHPDHGKVCLPIGADVGGHTDGGQSDGGHSDGGQTDGGQTDGGDSDGGPIESPTLVIEPVGATEQSVTSVSVTLIAESNDPDQSPCYERMQRRFEETSQVLSQTAEVDGDLPTFTFEALDANESYMAVVQGLSIEGVRRAFGCKHGLTPTLDGQTVVLDMQAQDVLLADIYSVELSTYFGGEWLGEYSRSLGRLPTHFAIAVLGCPGTAEPPCSNSPGDRGLLELLPSSMVNSAQEATDAVDRYKNEASFRDAFDAVFSDRFPETGEVDEGLSNDAHSVLNRKGRAELHFFRSDNPALVSGDVIPLDENYFVSNLDFERAEVDADMVGFVSFDAKVHPIFSTTQIFVGELYDRHIPNYEPGLGLSQVLESWAPSCTDVASATEAAVPDTQASAYELCVYLRDQFLKDVEAFRANAIDEAPLESQNQPKCNVSEPDSYSETEWWLQLDYQPLPIYERIEGGECRMKWDSVMPDGSLMSVEVEMSATVMHGPEE